MALTKQTKLARKRMNLIRSAQQRMFRQLRFTFTTSARSTLYSGEEIETTPPSSWFTGWSFLSLTGAVEDWSAPRWNRAHSWLTCWLVLLWNSSGLPGASSHFKSHISLTTSCSFPAGPSQKVLTRLIFTDLGTFCFCEKSKSMTQKSGRQRVWVCYC